MSTPRYAINARVDALLTIVDDEQRRLGVTSGEQVVLFASMLAQAFKVRGAPPDLLDVALGFIRLCSVNPGCDASRSYFRELCAQCSIDPYGGDQCRAES